MTNRHKLIFNKDIPVLWYDDEGKIIKIYDWKENKIYAEFRKKQNDELYGNYFNYIGEPIDNLTGKKIHIDGNPTLKHKG